MKVKFNRTFNCIPVHAKSGAANSEMVTAELLKTYCLASMLYSVEAMSLSSANVRSLENCVNTATYRIFGSCDRSSLKYIRTCAKPDNMRDLIQRKCDKFVDQFIGDERFTNVLFISSWRNVFCNFDVCSLCVWVGVFYFSTFNCFVLFSAFICKINYLYI